jgi:nucleotide-binding universal stress UspA family protein
MEVGVIHRTNYWRYEMLKPIQAILFATDLTSNCQQALDFTNAMATRFKATVYLLHVIEQLPEGVDGRLKDLLGRHKWEDLVNAQQANVHRSLTGKTSVNKMVRNEIQNFCKLVGIDDEVIDLKTREILISQGDVAENIISHAKENQCDLIVLGAKKGLFSKTSVGSIIKSVLKDSKIAVTVVPRADS